MTSRTAVLVAVLAAAGIAVAGCGGGSPTSAAPQSPTLPTGALNQPSPRPSGAAPAPSGGASGQTGDDKGGSNGGGGGGSDDSSAPAPTLADGLPSPNGNALPGSLPADFPLPSGTSVGRIAVRTSDITAPMEVPNGDQATAFWKTQLPAAGYKVVSAKVSKAFGTITFTGKGCIAGSDIQVSGEHIAFLCKRKA